MLSGCFDALSSTAAVYVLAYKKITATLARYGGFGDRITTPVCA